MALTKKDLLEFGHTLKRELSKEFTQQLKKELVSKEDLVFVLAQTRTDIVRDVRDEMDARFSSFRNEMKADRENLRKEIQADFMEVIHDNLLPAIDAVHHRVDCLEKKVDHVHHDLKQEIIAVRRLIHMPAT